MRRRAAKPRLSVRKYSKTATIVQRFGGAGCPSSIVRRPKCITIEAVKDSRHQEKSMQGNKVPSEKPELE